MCGFSALTEGLVKKEWWSQLEALAEVAFGEEGVVLGQSWAGVVPLPTQRWTQWAG